MTPARIVTWIKIMRLWSLTASSVPILAGAALAAADGTFSWVMLALTLACGCSLHVATNLLNSYGDYVSGVDRDAEMVTVTAPQLLTGELKPAAVFRLAIGILIAASALAAVIVVLSDWRLIWFAVPGILGCGFYTTGIRFKYLGLGVPAVFVLAGVLLVGASYFAQARALTWAAVVVSFPISCLVSALLLGNDLRDMSSDREVAIKTTALFLGARGARTLFYALHLLPYAGVAWAVAAGVLPKGCLLTLLAAPLTFGVVKATHNGFRLGDRAQIEKLEGMTAGTHFAFGLLVVTGLVLKTFFK